MGVVGVLTDACAVAIFVAVGDLGNVTSIVVTAVGVVAARAAAGVAGTGSQVLGAWEETFAAEEVLLVVVIRRFLVAVCVVVATVLVTMVGGAGAVAALARVAMAVAVARSLVRRVGARIGVALALAVRVRSIVTAVLVTVVASLGASRRVLVGVLVAIGALWVVAVSVTSILAVAVIAVAIRRVVRRAIGVLVVADDAAAHRSVAGAITIGIPGVVVNHNGAADDGVVSGEVEQDIVRRGRGDSAVSIRLLGGEPTTSGVLVWVVLTILVLLLEWAELFANVTTVIGSGSVLGDLVGHIDGARRHLVICHSSEVCTGSVLHGDGPAWRLSKLDRLRVGKTVSSSLNLADGVLRRLQRAWLVSNLGRRVLLIWGVPTGGGVGAGAIGPGIVVLIRIGGVVSVAMAVAVAVTMAGGVAVVVTSSGASNGKSDSKESRHLQSGVCFLFKFEKRAAPAEFKSYEKSAVKQPISSIWILTATRNR